jgi:hypothetical protein
MDLDFFKIFNFNLEEEEEELNNLYAKNKPENIDKKISPLLNNNYFYQHAHNYLPNESNIIYFTGTDTDVLFNENLKTMPQDWHYRTKEVFYQLNSSGYRTKEWKDIDWKNSIVIFGCSYVFGVGLAEDETIAYHLEKLTGKNVINMGYGGGSNDLSFINCTNMINNFDYPIATIFSWTSMDRFMYFIHKNIFHPIGAWTAQKKDVFNKFQNNIVLNLYENMTKNLNHIYMINYNYKLILQAMLKDKTQMIDFSYLNESANIFKCDFIPMFCNARDLRHPGNLDAINTAKYIYDKLK